MRLTENKWLGLPTFTLARDVNGAVNMMKVVFKPFLLAAGSASVHAGLVSEAGRRH